MLYRQTETPPRVWGRLIDGFKNRNRFRNTPTCVGKTLSKYAEALGVKKHPHVCGEDICSKCKVEKNLETPPRVWGRRFCCCTIQFLTGNTPTCVGKTNRADKSHKSAWKHPNVCGEDNKGKIMDYKALETPPRVWGRPSISITMPISAGNTPTCVGKTNVTGLKWSQVEKHPHVCGED